MNSQNITVFNVEELGFTALPHLPDLPARGILKQPAHFHAIADSDSQERLLKNSAGLANTYGPSLLDAVQGPK
jgi:hypothetical protein